MDFAADLETRLLRMVAVRESEIIQAEREAIVEMLEQDQLEVSRHPPGQGRALVLLDYIDGLMKRVLEGGRRHAALPAREPRSTPVKVVVRTGSAAEEEKARGTTAVGG